MNYRNLIRSAVIVALAVAGTTVVRGEIVEQIIVKVNGEIMTKTELESRQVQALRQMGQSVDAGTDDAQLRQALDRVTPQLLVAAVDEILLVQRGRELGYRMADDQFTSVLDSIKKDNKIESDEQFQAALKAENMTLSDLRKSLEKQMIISRVQQNEVMSKIAVNDEEARRYYQEHLAEFTQPRSVTLREIFITVPGDGATVNVGLDEEVREKIAAVRQRAVNGESYEKLAADLSDAPSKANAGLIGPLSLSDLSPDLQKLLESMKQGDITQPLRGAKGYQLLKLESATTSETKPFEEAREDISNRVFTDKRTDEFEKYLQKLRTQAIIEWKNQDVKKAYDQGLAAPRQAAAAPPAN
ncbi:MAG: peptidyl-prolyl cis-trans isomerase [Vicinamibacterales bacterium]